MKYTYGSYVLLYTICYLILVACVAVFSITMGLLWPNWVIYLLNIIPIGLGILFILVPPLYIGTRFAQIEERIETRREGWGLATLFSFNAVVLGILMSLLSALSFGPSRAAASILLNQYLSTNFLIVLIPVLIFYTFMNRFSFWIAVRRELKRSLKQSSNPFS